MPDRSVLLELRNADAVVGAAVSRRMIEHGLNPNLLAVLWLVYVNQPITPTELALEGGYAHTTVRDFVNELAERGQVQRVENADDRRSHFLELTEEGRSFLESAEPLLRELEAELDRELGGGLAELRTPLQTLRRSARGLLDK
jgi:DNA-binding MarR family transcriptional regulator